MISRHFSKDHCILSKLNYIMEKNPLKISVHLLISKSEIRTHILQPWSTAVPQNTTETEPLMIFLFYFNTITTLFFF